MDTASQKQQTLRHLKRNGSITPMEALRNFGCYRLGARIHELRQDSIDIKTQIVRRKGSPYPFGNTSRAGKGEVSFAKYTLQ